MNFAREFFVALSFAMLLTLAACGVAPIESSEDSGGAVPEQRQENPIAQPLEVADGRPQQDYQWLTKEEHEDLQAQRARFEAMTDEGKQAAREGGTVPCKHFIHLWWEENFDMSFIDYVGAEAFMEWIDRNRDSYFCRDIYSFAKEFGIDYGTLKRIVIENGLEEIYPLDRLEARYQFFRNNTVTWEENFVTPAPEDFALIEITEENRVFAEKNRTVTFEHVPETEAEQVVANLLFYYATNEPVKWEAMRLKPDPVDLNNPWVHEPRFTSFTVLDIKTMSEADIKNEVRAGFEADSLAEQGMFRDLLTISEYSEKHKLIDPIVIMADESFTYTEATRKRGPQLADDMVYRRYYIMAKNPEGAYRIADFSFVW